MDWFEAITGFRETGYEETRARLNVEDGRLWSRVNGRHYRLGQLELPSLHKLRERVDASGLSGGRLRCSIVRGDVRKMHAMPEFEGALFQVASQFNMLEMTSEHVTPEHGVTRYANDPTQGPACAIAAGAATIYRNYYAPVGTQIGQTRTRQLDGLADMGEALSSAIGKPVEALWNMQNGYAMCSEDGLHDIDNYLAGLGPGERHALLGKLRIGVHRDVEVTDVVCATDGACRPQVSQAFCSALPVAYSDVPSARWRAFATLVLDAAYEATLLSAVEGMRRGRSNIVLLTSLGGGAFGNDDEWIYSAMERALELAANVDLDVRLVSYGSPSTRLKALAQRFDRGGPTG